MEYGAVIERGEITAIANDGYQVKSLDRKGIVTPAIPAAYEEEYDVGDIVCFFLFRDGTGKIICKY